MDTRDNLLRCVDAFTACFSQTDADETLTRYRDDRIQDMYDHNLSILHGEIGDAALAGLITAEMSLCKSEGKDYCQVRHDGDGAPVINGFIPEVSHYGLYHRACDVPLAAAGNTGCEIVRAETMRHIDGRCSVELAGYADAYGADFCRRKNARNAEVYLAPGGVDTYVCYTGGRAVGKADLFLHGSVAMIEDFDMIVDCQRKGYGTAILRALMEAAAAHGAKTALLVADMGDTAKEMYEKLGFAHLPGRTGLLYKWER